MDIIPTTDLNSNHSESEDRHFSIELNNTPQNNENGTKLSKTENIITGKENSNSLEDDKVNESDLRNEMKGKKSAEISNRPLAKARPLSTKSNRSTDSKDKGKRRGPSHLLKGKLLDKRRSSSSDLVKGKGPTLSKKLVKKQEISRQSGVAGVAGGSTQDNEQTGSKLSITEEPVKPKDNGGRPDSSKSKMTGNGHINIDSANQTDKIKALSHDNKTKPTGIKKTWQRFKSEKVKEKQLISSQGNGSLPKDAQSSNVGDNSVEKQILEETITNPAAILTKNTSNEKPKDISDIKESFTSDLNQVSKNDGECSNSATEPAVQYANHSKDPEDEKTKSVVSNSDSWIQSAIPYLPLGLSAICLLMNIIIPGSGISSFVVSLT